MVHLRRPPKESFSIAKCIRRFSLTRESPRQLSGDFSADFGRSKAAKPSKSQNKATIKKQIIPLSLRGGHKVMRYFSADVGHPC